MVLDSRNIRVPKKPYVSIIILFALNLQNSYENDTWVNWLKTSTHSYE